MGDTITLNTIILLATMDFHDEAVVHGGSNRTRSSRRDEDERSMIET